MPGLPGLSDLPAPETGLFLTHFLTVRDVARSRDFYADVLGGEVVPAENPAIVKARQQPGQHEPGRRPLTGQAGRHPDRTRAGGPRVGVHEHPRRGHRGVLARAKEKGVRFLTEPLDRKAELRCYMQDPDGRLIEVGQATGMLRGVYADPPAGSGTG
ncbi:VOC family protein [Streptomyces marianii]|uniref:VOC family protein n=1 Tax=Streptomyces marianii TaxID=1817406 RepID=A0A5R9E285_9ACTN|nr:VOC family protein [Streptomyces marianii]TLQ43165.1 VOC family protein [Streptomyces marianii]